jgi:hypothetical protein
LTKNLAIKGFEFMTFNIIIKCEKKLGIRDTQILAMSLVIILYLGNVKYIYGIIFI